MTDKPEYLNLDESPIVVNQPMPPGDMWIGTPDAINPSRLLEAFARGEVTEGGLAEAGWRRLGYIADDDGPTYTPSGLDEFAPDTTHNPQES